MPLYDYHCPACAITQAVFKRIADLDKLEPCPQCGAAAQRLISAPMVQPDYQGYDCPITGRWIEGRRAHVENLRRHGCRLLEPGERQAAQRRTAQSDQELERALGETFDAEVSRLPARKREHLAGEMEAGLTVEITRVQPTA